MLEFKISIQILYSALKMAWYGTKVNQMLGAGAFGEVYRMDSPPGAPFSFEHPTVAVKMIRVSYQLVCPRVRVRLHKRVPSNFGPRNRVKEGKRFQEGTYINSKKDLGKMQDVNQRYLK